MLLSLNFLCGPFLDYLQYVCAFVVPVSAEMDPDLTGPEQRGRVISLDSLPVLFLMQCRKQLESNCLLCCKGILWAHIPRNVQHDTMGLYCFIRFLSNQSALSLYWP